MSRAPKPEVYPNDGILGRAQPKVHSCGSLLSRSMPGHGSRYAAKTRQRAPLSAGCSTRRRQLDLGGCGHCPTLQRLEMETGKGSGVCPSSARRRTPPATSVGSRPCARSGCAPPRRRASPQLAGQLARMQAQTTRAHAVQDQEYDLAIHRCQLGFSSQTMAGTSRNRRTQDQSRAFFHGGGRRTRTRSCNHAATGSAVLASQSSAGVAGEAA